MSGSADRYRTWDAAYVLGSLGPAERREYEQHLAGCEQCRAAVAELAGMPPLLGLLGPDQAMSIADEAAAERPDGDVVPLARVTAAARRRTWRARVLGAAAAVVLLAVGVVAGLAAGRDGPPPQADPEAISLQLEPAGGSGVTADVTLASRAWGTRLDWDCDYPAGRYVPDGVVYTLVLVDTEGERHVTATWRAAGSRATGLGAATDLSTDTIRTIEIGLVGREEPLASADL